MSLHRIKMFNCCLVSLTVLVVFGLPISTHAQAIPFAQHPHGHDCAGAGPISLNSDVTALLLDPADYAFYQMVIPQRGLLDVSIDPGAFDAWKTDLLDASCRPVEGAMSDNSMITGKWARVTVPHKGIFTGDVSLWTLPPGQYFIRIEPNPVTVFKETFNFRTKFTPHYGHDFDTAEFVKLGSTVDGELLYKEDREVFRVNTTDFGFIRVWTTGSLTAATEPVIYVYSVDGGREAAPKIAGLPNAVLTNVLAPGTYFIAVEPSTADGLGKFSLHLDLVLTEPIFSEETLGN